MSQISWNRNTISLRGSFSAADIFAFSRAVHEIHTRQGYGDIVLDFSNVESVFETFMVPVIAQCRKYMGDGVDFTLNLPTFEKLRSLFHNSNWGHLLSPHREVPSTFVGPQHLPAQSYRSSSDQQSVVNRIMEVVIGSLRLERRQLKALEWCINEITDNVINHAQSDFGGVVQATTYATSNAVEFVVADAGIGIRRSLGETKDDVHALTRAIQEGVTRDARSNQGNGLYGSFRVSTISGGRFQIHSGRGSLLAIGREKIKTVKQTGPIFPGTAVAVQIVCNNEQLIEEALVFQGREHEPFFDYVEQKYEDTKSDEFNFSIKAEAPGFGTREAGRVVQNKLMNLVRAEESHVINVDFQDVFLVSSSFADEAIGKVFHMLGPLRFMQRIRIKNTDRTIQGLIDRAIMIRSRQGVV